MTDRLYPVQSVVLVDGVARFRENRIVSYLLAIAPTDLNVIGMLAGQGRFSREEQEQFAQLIGYSVGGASELEYVSNSTLRTAELRATKLKAVADGEPTRDAT